MIKPILMGMWVSTATMGAAYVGANWQKPGAGKEKQEHNEMTPVRTRMISVPVIAEGAIRGYVVAQFAFTTPAALMKQMPVKPDMFVVDEAFALIYAGEDIDFRQFRKQDLISLSRKVADNVNKRMGARVVEDVFIQELNYVPADKVRGGSQ